MPNKSWPPETPSVRKRRVTGGKLKPEEWAVVPAWRVGKETPRAIYRGDELIGIMDAAEDAALVVKAVNKFFSPEE
jgi:hypothetical protein